MISIKLSRESYQFYPIIKNGYKNLRNKLKINKSKKDYKSKNKQNTYKRLNYKGKNRDKS